MDKTLNPPVPVNQAVAMTTNWRIYFGNITGTAPADALRAFKIPLEDLKALVDMARVDTNITSVRAYLALGEAIENGPLDFNDVHILLVPVDDTASPAGEDVLEVSRSGKMVSTIMDFTTPCPALCDTSSVLYGPQNSNG